MESDTQSLTREQQADILLSEGLAANRDELLMRLDHIDLYRMNGYAHTFRERGDDGAECQRKMTSLTTLPFCMGALMVMCFLPGCSW